VTSFALSFCGSFATGFYVHRDQLFHVYGPPPPLPLAVLSLRCARRRIASVAYFLVRPPLQASSCTHSGFGFTLGHPWRLGYRAATTRLPVASLQLACCPHTTCPLPACSVAPTCLPTAHNFMVNCPAGGFVPGLWIYINIASFAIVASGPATCCEPWRRRLCLSIHWPCGVFAAFLLL